MYIIYKNQKLVKGLNYKSHLPNSFNVEENVLFKYFISITNISHVSFV